MKICKADWVGIKFEFGGDCLIPWEWEGTDCVGLSDALRMELGYKSLAIAFPDAWKLYKEMREISPRDIPNLVIPWAMIKSGADLFCGEDLLAGDICLYTSQWGLAMSARYDGQWLAFGADGRSKWFDELPIKSVWRI